MQLNQKIIESAYEAGILEEPIPLDIAFALMGEGYILEKIEEDLIHG